MKDEINFSYNGGGDAYLLQSVVIHFNRTVHIEKKTKLLHNDVCGSVLCVLG